MQHFLSRIQDQMIRNWNRPALCDYGGHTFTFQETATEIAILHEFFLRAGIRKGDRIAIAARNQARWGIAFLAASTYQAVGVPILADFTPEGISKIVNHSESLILFTDNEIWKHLDASLMPFLRLAVRLGDGEVLFSSLKDELAYGQVREMFLQSHPQGLSKSDVCYPCDNMDELAIINYTSGSTGEPKGVMLTHEALSANVDFGQKGIPSYPQDTMLSILPMAHMFGLMFELLYPLAGGTAVYYLGRTPSPTLLMSAMKEVRPFLLISVPMVFEKIYATRIRPKLEKPSIRRLLGIPGIRQIILRKVRRELERSFGGRVRTFILGGAALQEEVERFLRLIGLHFTVGYGMTEAGPLICYENWKRFQLRSCGKAMDYIQIRIDSEDPEHEPGEIQVRGNSLLKGYFKNPEATRQSFTQDGWFNTGDLGIMDRRGNLYIKGRSKTMLLGSNGQNIYPEEIENLLNTCPSILECLVVMRDRKVTALVCPDLQDTETAAAHKEGRLRAYLMKKLEALNRRLPLYERISDLEIREKPFEKTPKMSIKRHLYK